MAEGHKAIRTQKSFIDWTMSFLVSITGTILLSFILSVIVEWIGIRFFWKDQGSRHSAAMFYTEMSYLSGELDRTLMAESSREFAANLSTSLKHWMWDKTHAQSFINWIVVSPPADASPMRLFFHGGREYAQASVNMTLVFGVRLATLILSIPLFSMVALLALSDGLVERDLRKWGGGRESGYTFHIAKRFIVPTFTLFCIFLLSMPISINPAYLTLPGAMILWLSLRFTSSSFKKYL